MDTSERRLDATHADAANSDDTSEDADIALEEGLIEEVSNLFDDGVTYAQAEVAFQKTRAKLAGRSVGVAAAYIAIALILLHIALLALAVGLVIALQPLVTIWGAMAIVVGAILLLAVILLLKARSRGSQAYNLFSSGGEK